MFSEEVIIALKNRVGWKNPTDSVYSAFISSELQRSDSGLNFQSWHAAVTVENVYYTQTDQSIEESEFTDYLLWLEDQIIRKSVRSVFDNVGTCCNSSEDYTSKILQDISILDEVIGICMAVKVLELITTSTRSNYIERIGKHNYQKHKSDLEGYFDTSGKLVVKGLKQNYLDKVLNTSNKFCSTARKVILRDKTSCW